MPSQATDNATDDDTFRLANEPQRVIKHEPVDNTATQRVLFSGLECLPGQLDLFESDSQ